jgi:hypothetical protein
MSTHEQTLAELTAKIVEAVPEITELREGCRLVNEGDAWHEHAVITMGGCMFNGTTKKKEKYDPKIWKTLGRPITLEDVLIALQAKNGIHEIAYYAARTGTDIQKLNICFKAHETNWTLGKPLSEQSPETISFLHSLLHGE